MLNRSSQLLVYLLYSFIVAVLYGVFTFFIVYRSLADEIILHAYLWNIVFIVILLILDKIANGILLSKELEINEHTYFVAMLIHTFSFISFKTVLYLFYTFILIASRVSLLQPSLFSESFHNFILSIEYCLILLVAFDKFIEHLMKDDRRIKRITAKFTKFTDFMAKRRKKENNPS